jgi:hypothetical protein
LVHFRLSLEIILNRAKFQENHLPEKLEKCLILIVRILPLHDKFSAVATPFLYSCEGTKEMNTADQLKLASDGDASGYLAQIGNGSCTRTIRTIRYSSNLLEARPPEGFSMDLLRNE